jgi:hypothetical protein
MSLVGKLAKEAFPVVSCPISPDDQKVENLLKLNFEA